MNTLDAILACINVMVLLLWTMALMIERGERGKMLTASIGFVLSSATELYVLDYIGDRYGPLLVILTLVHILLSLAVVLCLFSAMSDKIEEE